MKWMKRLFLAFAVVGILGIACVFVFANSIIGVFLRSTLASLGEPHRLGITVEQSDLSLGGGFGVSGLRVTDLETETDLASLGNVEAEFGWGGLFSNPITVDRLAIDQPEFTLQPGIHTRFASASSPSADGPDTASGGRDASSKEDTGESQGFLLKQFDLNQGKVKYRGAGAAEASVVAQVDASAKNLSNSTPFEFDLTMDAEGETKGQIRLSGKVDPESLDSDIKLGLKDLSYPLDEKTRFPVTNGNASVILENDFSHILTSGQFKMDGALPGIPKEMAAGTPYELNWKVESDIAEGGAGKIELKRFDIAMHGLKGGPQGLKGSGSYDPKTAQGAFSVQGEGLSAPLLNTFVEGSAGMRILSGKAGVNLIAKRSGETSPFDFEGKLGVDKLALKDLSGKGNDLKFASVGLGLKARYAPDPDTLDLTNLSLNVDDVPLEISGEVKGLGDEKKRDVNVDVRGKGLDVGRLVTLFAPSMKETGTLSGKADIDLNVSGKTASEKFPLLVGSLSTKGITLVPAENPELKVAARGDVTFDSNNINAPSLDVKLGDVPGKLGLKVTGYNEVKKKIDANVRGVAIEPVVNLYKPSLSGLIVGKLDADVATVMGAGDRPDALDITFTINEGTLLTRHPIPSAIVNLVNWEWLKNGYTLTNAKGRIYQDEQGYVLDNIFLMGAKGGITMRGRVGFDNKLVAETRMNVAKSSVHEIPSLFQKALRSKPGSEWAYLGFDIGFPLGGSVLDVRLKPKFDLIGTGIERAKEELGGRLREKYGDEIREKTGVDTDELIEGAGGLLDGLFNRKKE